MLVQCSIFQLLDMQTKGLGIEMCGTFTQNPDSSILRHSIPMPNRTDLNAAPCFTPRYQHFLYALYVYSILFLKNKWNQVIPPQAKKTNVSNRDCWKGWKIQSRAFNQINCHCVTIRCHCVLTLILRAHAARREVMALYGSRCKRVQCTHLALQPALARRSVLPIPAVRGRAGRRSGVGWEKLEPTRFSSLPAIPRDLQALLTMVAVFQRAALPWNRTESPGAPTTSPAARPHLCPGQPRSPRRGRAGGDRRGGGASPRTWRRWRHPAAPRPPADPGPAPPHLPRRPIPPPRRPRAHGAARSGRRRGKRRAPAQVRPPPLLRLATRPPHAPAGGGGGETGKSGSAACFPPSLHHSLPPPPPARVRTKGRGPTPGERRSLCGVGASRSPAGNEARGPVLPARPRDREGRKVRRWGALTRLPSPRTFAPLALSLSPSLRGRRDAGSSDGAGHSQPAAPCFGGRRRARSVPGGFTIDTGQRARVSVCVRVCARAGGGASPGAPSREGGSGGEALFTRRLNPAAPPHRPMLGLVHAPPPPTPRAGRWYSPARQAPSPRRGRGGAQSLWRSKPGVHAANQHEGAELPGARLRAGVEARGWQLGVLWGRAPRSAVLCRKDGEDPFREEVSGWELAPVYWLFFLAAPRSAGERWGELLSAGPHCMLGLVVLLWSPERLSRMKSQVDCYPITLPYNL